MDSMPVGAIEHKPAITIPALDEALFAHVVIHDRVPKRAAAVALYTP